MAENLETATFASGCFWCSEAVFKQLKGVEKVTPGYSGGSMADPSYKNICSGETGHAEAIQILFDPQIISFEKLLEVLFLTHDPTTLNRQGGDAGPQYRSAIFYQDETQRVFAEKVKNQMEADKVYPNPIITQITPLTAFYPAETYHQDYYAKNPKHLYCQIVIDPKIARLRQKFASLMK